LFIEKHQLFENRIRIKVFFEDQLSNLVNQNRRMWATVSLDELSSIVGLAGFDAAQVPGEGFLAPRTLGGVTDGREGGDGSKRARVLQMRHKSTVTSHRVSGDRFPAGSISLD
jgi:hypothetical protein